MQTTWGTAYRGQYSSDPPRGNIGDVSFGTPDAAGPVTSYGATLGTQWQCENCTSGWPGGSAVYDIGASSSQFRVGWGEIGGQTEGLYPWWSGTIMLR